MEFFDDVLTKAKDVFDTAYKTTEKAVTVGKQKIDLSSMRSALAKRYELLGRQVIDAVENGEEMPDGTAAVIEDIRAREAAIKLAEEQLGQAQGKISCPACGAKNRTDAHFCSNCGEGLA